MATTAAPMARTTAGYAARPSVLMRGLHLGVVYALAVSQPLVNLLGNNADFFTSRQLSSGKVLWFALIVGLGIPLLLYAIDTVVSLVSDDVGWVVHLVLIFVLTLLLMSQIARKLIEPSGGAIILAALLAGGLAAPYAPRAPPRFTGSPVSPPPPPRLAPFLFLT